MSQVSGRKFFDTLPLEIKKRILWYLPYDDLCQSKRVCSSWKALIDKILHMETIPVSEKRLADAMTVFSEFHIYRTSCKDMFDPDYINGQLRDRKWTFVHPSRRRFLKELYYMDETRHYKDLEKTVWTTILVLTESDYTVDDFRNRNRKDKFVRSFMKKYEWYWYESKGEMERTWDDGYIAVYPDGKTFAVGRGLP